MTNTNTWAEGWEREEAIAVGARLVVGSVGAGWRSGGWLNYHDYDEYDDYDEFDDYDDFDDYD